MVAFDTIFQFTDYIRSFRTDNPVNFVRIKSKKTYLYFVTRPGCQLTKITTDSIFPLFMVPHLINDIFRIQIQPTTK